MSDPSQIGCPYPLVCRPSTYYLTQPCITYYIYYTLLNDIITLYLLILFDISSLTAGRSAVVSLISSGGQTSDAPGIHRTHRRKPDTTQDGPPDLKAYCRVNITLGDCAC